MPPHLALSRSSSVLLPVAVGLLVRLIVVGLSHGSNDVELWNEFSRSIRSVGLIETYRVQALFNHPPLIASLIAGLHYLASLTQTSFSYWLKIPALVGDVGAIWLAASLLKDKRRLVWLVVLSPVNVLIAAYHGNTDALCASACLFSAYLMHVGRIRASAVALGIAFNVKLIPAAFLLCLFGYCNGWDKLRRFVGWLAPFALPFAIALILGGAAFTGNMLGYSGIVGPWGFNYFAFHASDRYPELSRFLIETFVPSAKFIILGLGAVLGLLQFRRQRFTPFELGALAFGLTLAFAPGFGVQYMVYPVLFMLLAQPRIGAEIAGLCGLFVFATYAYYWTGEFPIRSEFLYVAAGPAEQAIGLIVWYLIFRATWLVYRGAGPDSPSRFAEAT